MGDKIEDSARYYQSLVDKHEASGRGQHQARVYRELVALVRRCSSYAEIQQRMKAGGYFESPGQALVLDELLAHRDAAAELGHERLVAIYQRRIDAVAADPRAAWTTGWEREVADETHRIGQIVDALNDVVRGYFELRCAPDVATGAPIATIRGAMKRMEGHGERLEAVVARRFYRKHCALADEVLAHAVQTARYLVDHTPDATEAEARVKARCAAMIAAADQAALLQKRRAYEARQRRAITLCVAPDDAPGAYTYERFYEGGL